MKILQTIASFDSRCGGTSTCTYDLISALHKIGGEVDLLTPNSPNLMGKNEQWIKAVKNDCISPYGYSNNIRHYLQNTNYDLYHINGLWLYSNHITCKESRKKNKPYIITPHGMLYPHALARSAWKKNIMFKIGGVHNDIKSAACIHVTCKDELNYIRALGYKNPVALIPNPVPFPKFISEITQQRDKKRIGFLGRLHPRKNVDKLIDAWTILENKYSDAELIIMGSGDIEYEQFLKKKIKQANIKNVIFTGFITGQEKFTQLASLTALCVPSEFENFGMIIPEALSVGTPVIASKGTPWEELEEYQCGYWVNNSPQSISQAIENIFSKSNSEILEMGKHGQNLVKQKYSDIQVAEQMMQLYKWLIYENEKPQFIYE